MGAGTEAQAPLGRLLAIMTPRFPCPGLREPVSGEAGSGRLAWKPVAQGRLCRTQKQGREGTRACGGAGRPEWGPSGWQQGHSRDHRCQALGGLLRKGAGQRYGNQTPGEPGNSALGGASEPVGPGCALTRAAGQPGPTLMLGNTAQRAPPENPCEPPTWDLLKVCFCHVVTGSAGTLASQAMRKVGFFPHP